MGPNPAWEMRGDFLDGLTSEKPLKERSYRTQWDREEPLWWREEHVQSQVRKTRKLGGGYWPGLERQKVPSKLVQALMGLLGLA